VLRPLLQELLRRQDPVLAEETGELHPERRERHHEDDAEPGEVEAAQPFGRARHGG
jgi:hypothetical protein